MLDVGADIRADAEDLLQYALMGASYARNGLGLERPRVGLLNVGTEEHKGRAELKAAHDLIARRQAPGGFDFVGFVEGGDIPSAKVDVIVTDGFTGNVALKTGEGTAALIREFLNEAFKATPLSRIAALLALTSLKRPDQADRPAPGERRRLPRPQRHGREVPRLGRRDRRLGRDQARLRACAPRASTSVWRPGLHPFPMPRQDAPAAGGTGASSKDMTTRAVVRGVGHYLPDRVVPNAEFEETLDTSDEWIVARTGIERRHFAAEGETTSDMAVRAARAALADAGLGPTTSTR